MTPDDDTGAQNLSKIDHVIVLMMENRSFDHVLGYLKLDGVRPNVDGLETTMGNEDGGPSIKCVRWGGGRSTSRRSIPATVPPTSGNTAMAAS